MFGSSMARIAVITVAVIAALGLLRYKPWEHSGAAGAPGSGGMAATTGGDTGSGRQKLTVGFLPVT
jgi:hypothetical protein